MFTGTKPFTKQDITPNILRPDMVLPVALYGYARFQIFT
jgi:hypothetical protein